MENSTQLMTTEQISALDQDLEILNLSRRPFNSLKRAGVDQVFDLVAKTRDEIEQVKNLGRQSLTEIHSKLGLFLETNAIPRARFPLFDSESSESLPADPTTADQSGINARIKCHSIEAETPSVVISSTEVLGMTLADAAQYPSMTPEKWGDFVAEYKTHVGIMKTRLDDVSIYGHSTAPLDPIIASHLSTRTRRALERAGIYDTTSLARMTVQDLIAIRQIGRGATIGVFSFLTSTLAMLSSQETLAKIKELKSKIATFQDLRDSVAPERVRWKELQEILIDEINKGRLDRRVQIGGVTIADLLLENIDEHNTSEIQTMCYQIGDTLRYLTIEDEIQELIKQLGDRKYKTLIARFGQPRQTLQEVADALGLTRERVRQLEKKAIEKISSWLRKNFLGRIQTMLLLAKEMGNHISLSNLEADLMERRLVSNQTLGYHNHIKSELSTLELVLLMLRANENAESPVDEFCIPENLRVAFEHPGFTADEIKASKALPKKELKAIQRQCRNAGTVSGILVGRKLKMSASAISKALQTHGYVSLNEEWLMEKRDDRTPISARHSAFQVNVIKMLSICGPLSLADIREGLQDHNSRFDFAIPPTGVLRKLLPEYGFGVDTDDRVTLPRRRRVQITLNSGEQIIFDQIGDHGPVVTFQELSEAFSEQGRSQPLLATTLRHSVLFRRVDDGLYILRGTKITQDDVESAARRRPVVEKNAALHFSSNGTITWSINVGSYALGGTIPAGQAARLIGEWTSRTQGIDTGKIKVGEQQIWGLAKAFQRLGVKVGERIALRFNPTTRQVQVEKLEKENHEED